TSFTQWMSPLNQTLLKEQLAIHHLNAYTKKLYITSFMKLLLYTQLHQTESLRAINKYVFCDDLQNAIQLKSISFSQLGRRLNQVPTAFFQSLFLDLVAQIHEKTKFHQRRKLTMPLKILDSSTMPLN